MNHFGSADQWIELVDSQIPDILELVVQTWESMPAPTGDDREDAITNKLCRALRRSRDSVQLAFRIDTQLVELDPAEGESEGRMDIVFSPTVPREDIYFCLECKRLNVLSSCGSVRPYFAEYVVKGMVRFITGQYAASVPAGGMLAYVLDSQVDTAIAGILANIENNKALLGVKGVVEFRPSQSLPHDPRVRETVHLRGTDESEFLIHHLFMAAKSAAIPSRSPSKDSSAGGD